MRENQNKVYDDPHPDFRNRLSRQELQDLPLLDANGLENPIYDKAGYPIERRVGNFSPGVGTHGLLFKLRGLHDLFAGEPFEDADDPTSIFNETTSTNYTVYPQAGLHSVGHFQADGLMKPFTNHLIPRLNKHLQKYEDDDGFGDDDYSTNGKPPIQGIACQGYNAVMHST